MTRASAVVSVTGADLHGVTRVVRDRDSLHAQRRRRNDKLYSHANVYDLDIRIIHWKNGLLELPRIKAVKGGWWI